MNERQLRLDRDEHEEFEKKQNLTRLGLKQQAVRDMFPNMSSNVVNKMANTLIELDAIGHTRQADEYDRNWEKRTELAEQRKLDEHKSDEELTQYREVQEQRIQHLCATIIGQRQSTVVNPDMNPIDYQDPDNHMRTSLHQAVYDNIPYEVRELINAGARTDLRDTAGLTPFQLAVREDYPHISNFLKDK